MKHDDPLPFLDGDMTQGRSYPTDIKISERQRFAMEMYSKGAQRKEVALAQGVSIGTTRSDILKVCAAGRFKTLAEACLELVRQGVIPDPPGEVDRKWLAGLINPRRIDIAELLARGLTIKEAGRVLGIKVSCVNSYYLQPLRDAAGARNTTHLLCLLHREGYLNGAV